MSNQTTEAEPQELEAALARLRAEKKESITETRAAGREVGVAWAIREDGASFEDLQQLNHWVKGLGDAWADGITPAAVAEAIDDSAGSEEVWESIGCAYLTEAELDDHGFLTGFVEGALEVFAKV